MTSLLPHLRTTVLFLFAVTLHSVYAQNFDRSNAVGVGVRIPTEKLHVNSTLRIESLPQNGEAKIYNNSSTPTNTFYERKVVTVDKNGVFGQARGVPQFIFYMPPILLPLCRETCEGERPLGEYTNEGTTTTDGRFIVDLYRNYQEQFGMTKNASQARSNSTQLPDRGIWNKDQLMFFVTYYDTNYFEDVMVDDNGILSYRVKKNVDPSENTYMNIVFRVKD